MQHSKEGEAGKERRHIYFICFDVLMDFKRSYWSPLIDSLIHTLSRFFGIRLHVNSATKWFHNFISKKNMIDHEHEIVSGPEIPAVSISVFQHWSAPASRRFRLWRTWEQHPALTLNAIRCISSSQSLLVIGRLLRVPSVSVWSGLSRAANSSWPESLHTVHIITPWRKQDPLSPGDLWSCQGRGDMEETEEGRRCEKDR